MPMEDNIPHCFEEALCVDCWVADQMPALTADYRGFLMKMKPKVCSHELLQLKACCEPFFVLSSVPTRPSSISCSEYQTWYIHLPRSIAYGYGPTFDPIHLLYYTVVAVCWCWCWCQHKGLSGLPGRGGWITLLNVWNEKKYSYTMNEWM